MSYTCTVQLVGLGIVAALALLLWRAIRRLPDSVVERLLEDLD